MEIKINENIGDSNLDIKVNGISDDSLSCLNMVWRNDVMPKYDIIVEEKCLYRIEVEANSEEEAKGEVYDKLMATDGEICDSSMRAKISAIDDVFCSEKSKWFMVYS